MLSKVAAQEKQVLSSADRVRIAEAFRLGAELSDSVWDGWSKTPFAVLIVTPQTEYIIRHPAPSKEFEFINYDDVLGSSISMRPRVFPINLQAAFPAIGEISTIVIGQAENTAARTSTPWVVTMLHEHFHQFQNSDPTYFRDVASLNLARGDSTAMWMLNYPFPYDSSTLNERFSELCRLLADAIEARGAAAFAPKFRKYREARQVFRNLLSSDDYRYFSFQLWQEGVARYTEYRIARLAAVRFEPGDAFRSLPDFTPFRAHADALYNGIVGSLRKLSLSQSRRTAFYPFGAAEALLLDAVNPRWKDRYFKEKFFLEAYFER